MCSYLKKKIRNTIAVNLVNECIDVSSSVHVKVEHVSSGLIEVISGESVLWKYMAIVRHTDDTTRWR